MRQRCSRVCVPLVEEDALAVLADKSLVTQDTTLAASGFHHLAGQRFKVVELAGFDCQLDPPRNLVVHLIGRTVVPPAASASFFSDNIRARHYAHTVDAVLT